MAKRGRPPKATIGEQLTLIDVGPENLKKITPHAHRYRQLVKDRLALQKQEHEEKEEIHRLIKESGLKHLPNGHITFECEGLEIDIEPRDEIIHVKEIKKKAKKPAGKTKAKPSETGNAGVVSMADQIAKDEADHDQAAAHKKTRKKKQRTVKELK